MTYWHEGQTWLDRMTGQERDDILPIFMPVRQRRFHAKNNLARSLKQCHKLLPQGWSFHWLSSRRLTFRIDWDRRQIRVPFPKDMRGIAFMTLALSRVRKFRYPDGNRIWYGGTLPSALNATPMDRALYPILRWIKWLGKYYTVPRHGESASSVYRQELRFAVSPKTWHMPWRWNTQCTLSGKSNTWKKAHLQDVHETLRFLQRAEAWDCDALDGAGGNHRLMKTILGHYWNAAFLRHALLNFIDKEPEDYPLSPGAIRNIRAVLRAAKKSGL